MSERGMSVHKEDPACTAMLDQVRAGAIEALRGSGQFILIGVDADDPEERVWVVTGAQDWLMHAGLSAIAANLADHAALHRATDPSDPF